MGYDMLSKTKIQKLRIGSKVCEGDGLYFKKTKADGGQWSYRYTSSGKSREIGLGVYPFIDLLEARRLRDDNRRLRAHGKDPIIEKRKAEQAKRLKDGVKFSDIAEKYITRHERQWRNKKSAQAWRNTLAKYVYPELDKWPLEDITSKQIADLLEPIWDTKSETARRVQQRIARIFDAACATGIIEGDNLILRLFNEDCETAHLLTSVYTMTDSRDEILDWNEKEILLSLNNRPHVAEILYPTEFLMGYRFLVSFGYTSVDNVKALFEDADEVSMELKDSDHLNVSDSVDIPRNTWSVDGAHDAIKRAQNMCRTMVAPPENL